MVLLFFIFKLGVRAFYCTLSSGARSLYSTSSHSAVYSIVVKGYRELGKLGLSIVRDTIVKLSTETNLTRPHGCTLTAFPYHGVTPSGQHTKSVMLPSPY